MSRKPHRPRRFLKRGLLVLLALALITGISAWASMNWLTVTRYECVSEKLTQPLTIVLISDLHDHEFGKNNQELIQKIAAQSPDMIVFAGDALNYYSKDDSVLIRLVQRLRPLAPIYYTVGNHDVSFMAVHKMAGRVERLERAGAIVLNSSYMDVLLKGQHLRIGGLYNYVYSRGGVSQESFRSGEAYQFLAEFEATDAFKLLLAHKPAFLLNQEENARWDVDLALCGHEHGGQVRLPLLGSVYSPHLGWFSPYTDGAHLLNGIPVIITRGLSTYLTMFNGWPTPPRLFNLPEIVTLSLLPAQDVG